MNLKHLRKTMMNWSIEKLRADGPLTKGQLLSAMPPTIKKVGYGTARNVLERLVQELIDRKFLNAWPEKMPDGWSDIMYALHDRMFENDVYIGHKLIDPEWPDDWMVKK